MALIAGLSAAFALLLLVAAALTASLSAVLKIDASRARILAEEGFAGAGALAELRTGGETATAVLGALRAISSLGATVAGVALVAVLWSVQGLWIGGPLVVLGVLLTGELGPRALAGRRPVRLALVAAPRLRTVARIFRGVLFPLMALGRVPGRRPQPDEGSPAERQMREAIAIGTGEGVVEADESRLIERAFRLDELDARDAMTPRVDIVAFRDSRPLGEALAELEAVPHSRVPVFGESIDDVTGILHVRDAYRAYVAGRREDTLRALAREAMFVPGSLSLAKLLAEFRARRLHMGIVADEFGGTDGLITLEDVLEELVGEIVDETDVDEDPVTRLADGAILALGAAEIREINERFDFGLQPGEHRSLNGFILEELGQVPATGESFRTNQVRIEIVEATDTQVVRARLRPAPASAEPE